MNAYMQLIEQYLYTQFPNSPVSREDRFEAISKAVFGSKQRRFGPMPSPESQVKIREIIRQADGNAIEFFMPWGASKQQDGHHLDVMEISALKQLQCLETELRTYGQRSYYHFRLEDLTDRYLLGDTRPRIEQIEKYVRNFKILANNVLPDKVAVNFESDIVSYSDFRDLADSYFPLFFDFLRTRDGHHRLAAVGWKGKLPEEQVRYYTDAYRSLGIPEGDQITLLAKYFSATLARVQLKAERKPKVPFVLIAFTHPVPGNPIDTPRLHYRTIPERYTNHHRSPWLAKGFLQIAEDGTVTPRVVTDDSVELVTNRMTWNGVELELDYQLT